MNNITKTNTAPYVRLLGRLTKPFPNFDFSFIKPVRQKAVELLDLKPGDRVIDAGCGSGGSFPNLVNAVGPTGEVVGIEISPNSKAAADRRIKKNGWENVQVIESDVRTVALTGKFDGLLMFAAADVYASEEALGAMMPHLKENARIAFFGAKLSRTGVGRMLNPVFRSLFKLSFATTPALDYEPWKISAQHSAGLDVREYFFGSMFLASGTRSSELT